MTIIETQVPEVLEPLLYPARYKAAHGGRGGGKSHFFAEQVVIRCLSPNRLDVTGELKPVRIVCIREVQNSIKESVKQLIADKIIALGVSDLFEVLDAEIRGPNDSLIIFKGMQSHNASNIKSLEGFDIAWVEEAQTLSDVSLRMLRPTIRKEYQDGTRSELWFSWNPRFETDAVDKFFRGDKKPEGASVVQINWYDNPWLPNTLTKEKDQDYETDPEMAEHVWGGGYERITAGAYFAKHIANLEREHRVGYYPYDPALPVFTSWDLGVDDYTSIWFFQVRYIDGMPRIRIIDFYEASGIGADEILASAMPEYTKDFQSRVEANLELGRDKPYTYTKHFFPHDIGNREWGAGAKTRIQTVNSLGIPITQIKRGVAQNPEERINAVRRILPMCEFNQTQRVMLGLTHLRRYSRKMNERLGIYLGPSHDEHSHAADSFGEFAVNCGIYPPEPAPDRPKRVEPTASTWQIPPVTESSSGRIKV